MATAATATVTKPSRVRRIARAVRARVSRSISLRKKRKASKKLAVHSKGNSRFARRSFSGIRRNVRGKVDRLRARSGGFHPINKLRTAGKGTLKIGKRLFLYAAGVAAVSLVDYFLSQTVVPNSPIGRALIEGGIGVVFIVFGGITGGALGVGMLIGAVLHLLNVELGNGSAYLSSAAGT